MTRSRFSHDEKISVLKEHENGKSIATICSDIGISVPTFYNWKRKYITSNTSAERIKNLESENYKLKQMYADLCLKYWGERQ